MGELNIYNFIYFFFIVMLGFDAYAKKQLYILYINKVAFFKRFDNQVNGIMQNTHIKK